MSKSKKIFLVILVIVIIASAIGIYLFFKNTKVRDTFSVIPNDAVFIIETNNLTNGWSEISESEIWQHLLSSPSFQDINKSALGIDSLIKDNSAINALLNDRQLLVSAHMISKIEYDFLFTIELGKISKISVLSKYIQKLIRLYEYESKESEFEGNKIIEINNINDDEKLYLSFIDNLLVCSYSKEIIKNSISQKDENNWLNNDAFTVVSSKISNRKLFSFYINYSLVQDYLHCFLSEQSDLLKSLGETLSFSAMNLNIENEEFVLNGYTNFNDSLPSYIRALNQVKVAKTVSHNIISDNAAIYISLCFRNFNDFFNNLNEVYLTTDSTKFESYSKKIKKVEKLLKINLKENFFDWIGNEIAFIKLQPRGGTKEKDVVILIHSNNIEKAKEGLGIMTSQIQKRSPMKFKTINYQNHEIQYLNIKGFFKMFFGKLFGTLEKPYFSYIEDFVVFSNSPASLMYFIDDYTKGNTLSHKEEFMNFKNSFDKKSNISIYVQMPKIYSHLYYFSNAKKRKGISKNKELILSFANVGFQMNSEKNIFKTTLKASHNKDAEFLEVLDKIELAADDISNTYIELLNFKINLTEEELNNNTFCKIFYPDSSIKAEGLIKDEYLSGLWRSYFKSGNIMNAVNYEKGKVNGTAYFYYDNQKECIKSQINFDDNRIVDKYLEFYESGARKASVTYQKGKPNGEAEFYYNTGVLKIKGKYKDGIKSGKWKHYTMTGELIDKEKWKKGNVK